MNGQKTYIVAALTALYAVLGLLLGYHEVNYAVELFIVAGGMVGIRSALKKQE